MVDSALRMLALCVSMGLAFGVVIPYWVTEELCRRKSVTYIYICQV